MEIKKCSKCGMELSEEEAALSDICDMCMDVRGKVSIDDHSPLLQQFSLTRGYPRDKDGLTSVRAAENAVLKYEWEQRRQSEIRRKKYENGLSSEELREWTAQWKRNEELFPIRTPEERFHYNAEHLLQHSDWWWFPHVWIGRSGYIVNKKNLLVNALGSSNSLENCFWGHNHGIYCDLVDFTFAPDTSLELAGRLLRRFKSMTPHPKSGKLPLEERWYLEPEIESALTSQFPVFKNHFVWFAIPKIRAAWQNEGLRFTCKLSEKAA